jgi:hypothetical protein
MKKTKMIKNNFFYAFFTLSFIASSSLAQDLPSPVGSKQSADSTITIIDKIDPSRFYNIAVVQGLNKTTAKTSTLEIRIGEKTKFGQISIIAHKCWQASLDQKPESKILLEVFEKKEGIETRIFYGWMFASSPSISGLEHPIYDLTAVGCKNK